MAFNPAYTYDEFGQPTGDGQAVYAQPTGPAVGGNSIVGGNASGDTLARGAGYIWDPVQNRYVKGPITSDQAISAAHTQGSYINALLGDVGGSMSALTGLQTAGAPREGALSFSGGQPGVGPVAPADPTQANNATFAKAKDSAGASARGALTGLRESLAERGMLGSGAGASAERAAVERANQPVNDVVRQQAVQDEQTNNTFALANLQSSLSQRAQNLQEQDAIRGAQLTQRSQDIGQRGQDISMQEAQAARNASILRGLMSSLNINASMEY